MHDPHFERDPCLAFRSAFSKTDQVQQHPITAHHAHLCSQDFLRKGAVGGSTAVCALIRHRTLYLAWLGDAEAVLSRAGHAVSMMNPHKPSRKVLHCSHERPRVIEV